MLYGSHLNGFKKLLQICCTHSIAELELKNEIYRLKYGPLGTLIKRNIFNEWLSSFLNNGDVNIFPLELVTKCNTQYSPQKSVGLNSVLSAVIRDRFDFLHLNKQSFPIGFATYGPYTKEACKDEIVSDNQDFSLRNFKSWSHMSLVFLCPPKKSMYWFNYWSKQRYIWWRKFSSVPSKFSMSEVSQEKNAHQLSLQLQFPWGNETLETVTVFENSSLSDDWKGGAEVPSAVVCEAGLDSAMLAYLSNSFAEKRRNGQTKNVLQLHYKLAPYKVSIVLQKSSIESERKLKDTANHLTKELRESNILLFPTSYSDSLKDFSSFDEMAVPYLVILNDATLTTGIIELRSRDTTLQEQVHMTELVSKLQKYLKVNR